MVGRPSTYGGNVGISVRLFRCARAMSEGLAYVEKRSESESEWSLPSSEPGYVVAWKEGESLSVGGDIATVRKGKLEDRLDNRGTLALRLRPRLLLEKSGLPMESRVPSTSPPLPLVSSSAA